MFKFSFENAKYVVAFCALLPIAFAAGTVLINGTLRPIFIPSAEIDAIAADLIRRFEDPLGAAMIEEHAAWYRSDNFSQGKWRRVRKRIATLVVDLPPCGGSRQTAVAAANSESAASPPSVLSDISPTRGEIGCGNIAGPIHAGQEAIPD